MAFLVKETQYRLTHDAADFHSCKSVRPLRAKASSASPWRAAISSIWKGNESVAGSGNDKSEHWNVDRQGANQRVE
jgi:hypothetical protein